MGHAILFLSPSVSQQSHPPHDNPPLPLLPLPLLGPPLALDRPDYLTPRTTTFTTITATGITPDDEECVASPSTLWSPTVTFKLLDLMDAAGPTRNPSTAGGSPAASNASASDPPSASAAAGTSSSSATRKKPGRGPGKKDSKEKATVSVRWDDGDLTERLIAAIEGNDRWTGVFATSSSPGEGAAMRPPPAVAKRDLQREIAKHLFSSDNRFDLEDKKVLENLAVSVKNKLFKITTLFNECKAELGHVGEYKSEREIPQGSEQAVTWARVRVKFPQFFRIRDLMNRLLHLPGTPHSDFPASPVEPSSSTRSRTDTGASSSIMNPQSNPGPSGSSSSSALRGAVDLPKDLPPMPYVDTSVSIPSASYMGPPTSGSTVQSPTYPQHSPGLGLTSVGYSSYPAPLPPQHHPQGHRRTDTAIHIPSSHPVAGPSQPSIVSGTTGPYGGPMTGPPSSYGRHHQPQARHHYVSPSTLVPHSTGGGGGGSSSAASSPRPSVGSSSSARAMTDAPMATASPAPPPREHHTPSPPLAETIQAIVNSLTDKKDRDKAREHELEIMRLQREEAERVRWHQREMMRLRIQLIRAERAAGARAAVGAPHGTAESFAGVEDSLGMVAGMGGGGDDGMSMEEGDGEGELEEDIMLEAEASGSHHTPQAHHHHAPLAHSSHPYYRHSDTGHPGGSGGSAAPPT